MDIKNVNRIVVHCSATRPGLDLGARDIRRMHTQPKPEGNGWSDIGYHWVIRRSGAIETGRPETRQGAHVGGHNENSWGVCLVGGVSREGRSEDNFTLEQYQSLEKLLKALEANSPAATGPRDVCGHRDLSPDADGDGVVEREEWLKDCPCFDVRAWWERVSAD